MHFGISKKCISKKIAIGLAACLGLLLLCQCPTASSQPLATTYSLDELFSLDSSPSIQRKLPKSSTVFSTNRSSPVQPSTVKTTFPQKESVAYLASMMGSGISPIAPAITPFSSSVFTDDASASAETSAQDLLTIARSPELVLALQRMNATPQSRTSFNALRQRGGRVLFKNLTELGNQYASFDALAWLSKDPATQGAWIVFIAEKHRKAPPEALASLITHEAMHGDFQNSYCEEEHAWLAEVTTWKTFKAQNPTLQHIPKGWFALVDRLNAIEMALTQQTLKAMIRNNPGYAGLQEVSPYFRYSPFSMPTDTSQPTSSGKSAITVYPNNSLLQQQPAFAIPPKRPATRASVFSLNPKPFPLAVNGRPKLTLRPLRTW